VFPLNFHGNNPLYTLGQIYVLVLFARAVLSWFPYNRDSPFNPVRRVIFTLTEPVLAPFRRIIPPIGMLDLSFLVAIIVVEILVGFLGRVHF
jgi:YggT family protein